MTSAAVLTLAIAMLGIIGTLRIWALSTACKRWESRSSYWKGLYEVAITIYESAVKECNSAKDERDAAVKELARVQEAYNNSVGTHKAMIEKLDKAAGKNKGYWASPSKYGIVKRNTKRGPGGLFCK